MSHLGLMSPCAKGNSWAPSSDVVGLRESRDLTPHPMLPLLSRCAAKIPQASSLQGRPPESCRDKRVEAAH